jgi:hypothetical protein
MCNARLHQDKNQTKEKTINSQWKLGDGLVINIYARARLIFTYLSSEQCSVLISNVMPQMSIVVGKVQESNDELDIDLGLQEFYVGCSANHDTLVPSMSRLVKINLTPHEYLSFKRRCIHPSNYWAFPWKLDICLNYWTMQQGRAQFPLTGMERTT